VGDVVAEGDCESVREGERVRGGELEGVLEAEPEPEPVPLAEGEPVPV